MRRSERTAVQKRILGLLGLLGRLGTALTVRELELEFGIDGPSERAIRIAVGALIASGELAASGEPIRPETYRATAKGPR